jgi:3-oxoacyl-[acyl-carrier protein] reductase
MDAPFGLLGRPAFVTGSAQGIGRAIAVLLGSAGAAVMCVDRSDACHETASFITSSGGTASSALLDVSQKVDVDAAIGATEERFGPIEICVNAAGVNFDASALELTESDLDRMLAINLKGTLFCSQASARSMITRGRGSIVNVVSGVLNASPPGTSAAYGMSKAAIHQLTRTMATELGPVGVRVNSISPGFIRTAMSARRETHDGVVDVDALNAHYERRGRELPLGRVGEPEDVAPVALFLASDASAYCTGQMIRPDGGLAMPW